MFNLKIAKKDLLLIILFIPFLTYNFTAKFDDAWKYVQMVDAIVIILLFFYRHLRGINLPKLMLFLGILVCLFTYINNPEEMQSALYYSLLLFSFFLLMDVIMQREKTTVLKFIVVYEGAIIIINTIFQIINPTFFGYNEVSGNNYNFFMSDNELIYAYLPYIALLAVYSWRRHGEIKNYVYAMLGVCTVSMVACWSATGLVGIVLLWILIICRFSNWKILTFRRVVIVFILIYVGIVVFRVHEFFGDFIVNVLNKDITLSSRTVLWDYALEYLKEHWLIGAGTMEGGKYKFIPTATGEDYSSHSFFLEIMIQTGILGLISYVSMFLVAGRQMMRHKNTSIYFILTSILAAFLIMYLTEGNMYAPLQYMLLFAMYYIDDKSAENTFYFRKIAIKRKRRDARNERI